jgi:general stress protein YciG
MTTKKPMGSSDTQTKNDPMPHRTDKDHKIEMNETATGDKPTKTPSKRGFAAMDKEKQREIASKGGKASHGGGRKPSKNKPQ